jgi:multiple sugar transport system substrate-binding protein
MATVVGNTRRQWLGSLGRSGAGSLALAGAMAPVQIACTGAGGSRSDQQARAQATVVPSTIRFTYWGADPEEVAVQDHVIGEFQKRIPQVRVENSGDAAGTAPYHEKLVAQMAAGTAPDVARIQSANMPRFAKRGLLLALDDFVRRENYKLDDFWAAALPLSRYQQKLFTLPVIGGPNPLFWNSRLFREAGIAPASELDAKGEWTWDRFADIARRLTKRDGDTWSSGSVAGYSVNFNWGGLGPFLWSAGGDYFNANRNKCTIAEPAAMEAVQFMFDLVARHRVGPLPGENTPALRWFPNSTIAMQVSAITASYQWRRDPNFEFDVVLNPKGKAAQIGLLNANGYGLMSATKAPPASWAFLKHLASEETIGHLASIGRSFPWRRSIAQSREYRENQPVKSLDVLFKLSDKNGKTWPVVPEWDEIERFANPVLTEIATGKASLRDGLERIRTEADRLLASG